MAVSPSSIFKRIHKTFSDLRTGVILLILTGIAAALGTFILQRPATESDKLARAYSPAMLHWLDRLGLTDVFHAWWFLTLLGLVSLSIVLVSINRFPNAWRFYARPYRKTDIHFRSALKNKIELPIKNAEDGLNAAERALKKTGWPVERIATDRNEPSLYSERHRFSVMAVYIVHASLLLIFAGGITDGLFGFSGFMTLQKNQTSNVIQTRKGGAKQIPFSLKCYGAGQENYADGSPKRWWSNLAIVENGKDVASKQIVVNDPLVYHGLRFYQSSFGPTGNLDGLKLMATPTNAAPREITLSPNEPLDLDVNTSVTLAEFIPDFFIRDNQVFKRSDDPVNPAFRLSVKNKTTNEDATLWIFPAYNENAQGQTTSYNFAYRDMQMGYFTGLEVSHEPGQWLVWGGVLLMGAGLFVAFYLVHMRVWIAAIPDARGRLVLWVGGQANKNRDRFEQKFNQLVDNIRTELEGAAVIPPAARKEQPALTLAGVK
ncbi:MAG: cytochrome c biogenesis protein ResB [Candidatus Korobacteraceae bacterium]